jgi:hypothetical protein
MEVSNPVPKQPAIMVVVLEKFVRTVEFPFDIWHPYRPL